jgi:hypothetical protein
LHLIPGLEGQALIVRIRFQRLLQVLQA